MLFGRIPLLVLQLLLRYYLPILGLFQCIPNVHSFWITTNPTVSFQKQIPQQQQQRLFSRQFIRSFPIPPIRMIYTHHLALFQVENTSNHIDDNNEWYKWDMELQQLEQNVLNSSSFTTTTTTTKTENNNHTTYNDHERHWNHMMKQYTRYLQQLSNTQTLHPMEIAKRAEYVWDKLNDYYYYYRGNTTIISTKHSYDHSYDSYHRIVELILQCMTRSNQGTSTITKMMSVIEQYEQQFYNNNNNDALQRKKSTSSLYLPIFQVATRCRGNIEVAQSMKHLLHKLQQTYEIKNDFNDAPTDAMYTATYQAYAKVHGNESTTIRIQNDIKDIWDDICTNPKIHSPSIRLYRAAIHVMTQVKLMTDAEQLFKQMNKPDSIVYQSIIQAYAKMQQAVEADFLLWELQHIAEDAQTKTLSIPDRTTITLCIMAWVKAYYAKQVDLVQVTDRITKLVELLFHHYYTVGSEHQSKHSSQRMVHHSKVLDDVMQIIAENHKSNVGEQVERMLRTREKVQALRGQLGPTIKSYIITIDAWVASRRKDAGCKALALLHEVDHLAKEGKGSGVNIRLLSTTLSAIYISSKKVPREVEHLFHRMIELYDRGDRSSVIDSRTQTNVFTYLMKNGNQHATAHRALEFLGKLKKLSELHKDDAIYPNTIAHNSVLSGLAHRGMWKEAEILVTEMEEESSRKRKCAPDAITYTNLIRAMSTKKRKLNIGKQAEQIIRNIEQKRLSGSSIVLDTQLYNAVLNAYAQDASASLHTDEDAERILFEMDVSAAGGMKTTPDLVSFGCVAQAYGKSKSSATVKKVYEILNRVDHLQSEGKLKYEPDYIFYSTLTTALTSSNAKGSMQLVGIIMERMKNCKGRNTHDLSLYNRVLSGWSRSKEKDRLNRCESLLDQMLSDGITPDLESHNSIIAAASTTRRDIVPHERLQYFEVALHHFRVIHTEDLRPNSFTYSAFIRACRNLLFDGEDRLQLVSRAFHLCQSNGLVTNEVCGEVYKAAPCLLQDVLASSGHLMNEKENFDFIEYIPKEWCSNMISHKVRK